MGLPDPLPRRPLLVRLLGIGLTDLQVRGRPDEDSEFKDRYRTFVNILHKFREEGTNAITTYLKRE